MLDRHVYVFADLRLICDCLDKFISNTVIVNIHEPDPFDAVYSAELLQKFRKAELSVQVAAVLGGVLSDQDQLPDPCVRHVLRLTDAVLDTLGPVVPAYRRDRAEAARVVASFSDLEIARIGTLIKIPLPVSEVVKHITDHVGAACSHLRSGRFICSLLPVTCKDIRQPVIVVDAEEHVHLRHLLSQLRVIALRQAAGNYQLHPAALLLSQLEYPCDGFLLGILNKAAGVDDHDVSILRIKHDAAAPLNKSGCQHLRIIFILGTAKCVYIYVLSTHLNSVSSFLRFQAAS